MACSFQQMKQLGKDTQCNVETRWAYLCFVRSKSDSVFYTCTCETGILNIGNEMLLNNFCASLLMLPAAT